MLTECPKQMSNSLQALKLLCLQVAWVKKGCGSLLLCCEWGKRETTRYSQT